MLCPHRPQNGRSHPSRHRTNADVRQLLHPREDERGRQSARRHHPLFGQERHRRQVHPARGQQPDLRLEVYALYPFRGRIEARDPSRKKGLEELKK